METPFIDIHTHRPLILDGIITIENVFASDAGRYKDADQPFSAGLHPWHIKPERWIPEMDQLESTCENLNMIAIGETGLDRLTSTPFDLQKEVFTRHLLLAEKYKKPVIVHCVKAFDEIIKICDKLAPPLTLIFHGFNNNRKIAQALLDHSFYFSLGQALFYEKSNAADLISILPDDRYFLETDDSGYSIEEVYLHAARLKRVSLLDMKKMIASNFERCFPGISYGQ